MNQKIPPVSISNWKPVKDLQFPFMSIIQGKYTEPFIGCVIGVDPGVNFGITFIQEQEITICSGHLLNIKKKTPGWEYGIIAYDFMRDLVKYVVHKWRGSAVIEGASYNDTYGQVGLESVRFALQLGMIHSGFEVKVAAPKSARKAIFNDVNMHAGDYWPLIKNNNAADSLAIALYALKLKEDNDAN